MENASEEKIERIYLSIDHLKKGTYLLTILLDNKEIKTLAIKK